MGQLSTTQRHSHGATQVPVMPNIAHFAGDLRPGRGEHDGLHWAFDMPLCERSVADQRAHVTEGLATVGEMIGRLAHDFRNILAIIESSLRFTETHSWEPEKGNFSVAAASDEIDRELKLTSQLFAFAKQRKLPTQAGNANEYLKTLELLRPFSDGSEIRIVLEFASEISMCLLESSQLNAVIIILVVNAWDVVPDGGEIQIDTVRWEVKTATHTSPAPGTYVRARVKDSGQGMSPETLK